MANEDQITEIEVLKSIYEGDSCFNAINDTTFQYKFGEDGEKTSFLLEMQWPPEYPEVVPTFNLNAFYNNHISSAAKAVMIAALNDKASKNVGDPQGYTIFEWARYSMPDVMLPIEPPVPLSLHLDSGDEGKADTENISKQETTEAKTKTKKEQLTKSQKRREWNRCDAKGEKVRGHDWVDVIRHLSQTGSHSLPETLPSGTTTAAVTNEDNSD